MDQHPLRFSTVPVNGIQLHVAEAGPPDGPLVILLHGFPEFWYGWRRQIPALAAAGFHVVAPDQRGYNLSSKPAWVVGYRTEALVSDVLALADHFGRQTFRLAGHDWGAFVAWSTALTAPRRVEKLAILNVPHPTVAYRALRTSPEQMLRSTYAAFFQLPRLPEAFLRRGGAAWMLRASSRPGTFTRADLTCYREAWSRRGALTAMLNWYRAALRYPFRPPMERVQPPTLILWGRHDTALRWQSALESLKLCEQGELIYYPASHWVQHEMAEQVSRELLGFFA